ncbi:hypothetical protein [Paracoccus zhejiangensis]|uniref:OB-fold nucleic acid binding domain-containing protein n=1 Tax=Paracoccus zhejiangensis TaxID=1077935 RepID=A0A2H5EU83_9RHOB|nr:hypothetical protein [Paracoccus zhejiangensis]AUH62853.1 hypothetical protein CX676_00635 [Paracoccus zhejiangensis]
MLYCPLPGRRRHPLHAPADTGAGDWSGFEDELTSLDATITDLALSGRNPSLQVRARDGLNWTIELVSRDRMLSAGLTERLAAPGDAVSVTGRLSRNTSDTHIKALRLTIAGRAFELFPEELAEG